MPSMADERIRDRFDAEPLRSSAMTLAESFPADWRTATFQIEFERTAGGPRVFITSYEIHGEDHHEVGKTCG